MKNPTYPHQPNNRFSELRIVTRSLLLLALLTGVVYLRVFAASGLSVVDTGDRDLIGILSLLFLIAATAGLLATWRWEGFGGLVATGAGLSLGILTYLTATDIPWLTAFFYGSPFIIAGGLSLLCWRQGWSKSGDT